ncbi:MAG: putative carbohydrate kinase [Pseudonocardiales bacterium]|nr:putative carbohydrate kinase [Pseudonocardiales bacterium]
MRGAWPVDEIRAAEEQAMKELPDGVLMQRASAGLATECLRLLGGGYGRSVLLLVGAGNNGGDALYAGALLARRGVAVTAALLNPDKSHPGGLAALRAAGGRLISSTDPSLLVGIDIAVDGLLGIGGKGGLRPDAAALADRVNEWATDSGGTVVAVDLPSGVDADTGVVDGTAIRADVTVTFGELKVGILVGNGADQAGQVHLVGIGLEPYLPESRISVMEAADIQARLVSPGSASDKYTRGVVGVVSGSPEYMGAAVLSVGAALHGGAGMVRYVGAAGDAIRRAWPEVVVHSEMKDAGRVQAWVIGPGLGTDEAADRLVTSVLASEVPVLVDADAITLLVKHKRQLAQRRHPTVLTPHDREFARIFGDVGPDRVGAARRAAAQVGATVLLKGNATVIADPGGRVYVNPTGTPWLATAGSGDVLSGLTGSILASGSDATESAALGAYVHGVAGQLAGRDGPPSAGDVLAAIRPALQAVRGQHI